VCVCVCARRVHWSAVAMTLTKKGKARRKRKRGDMRLPKENSISNLKIKGRKNFEGVMNVFTAWCPVGVLLVSCVHEKA